MDVTRLEMLELDKKSPQEIIQYALETFDHPGVAFSGAEDVAVVDMAVKIHKGVRVFFLDPGRLHPETYAFVERVRTWYDIRLEVFFPDFTELEKLVAEKGLYSFLMDGHKECCEIRKVHPLKRALSGLDAWITGQRKDQSPNTRSHVPAVQVDPVFGEGELIKFNPLANWTSAQVWAYIREHRVPYNKLHEKGYVSIGCEPCTRPVLPGQHEREGRWWWEDATKKECGLHVGNLDTKCGYTI